MSIQETGYISPDDFWLELNKTVGAPVGRTSIYEGLKSRRIRHVKIGRKYLIPRSELTDWLEREAEAALA